MICSVLYHSTENEKVKVDCDIFNIQMFLLPIIHILTLMTTRNRGKKDEVYAYSLKKRQIISRGTLSRESLSKEEAGLFKCL